jgi:tRNA/tmRNA/rRNA uracil-C5-methylase (TrmA/RlmC/RlmD family)
LRLRRDVRGFFQGNRFLLERLVRHVASLVPDGPVIDLYAGVGLFGLSLAAAGRDSITLVEGDPINGGDLLGNAEPFRGRVRVERRSVEMFLGAADLHRTTRLTHEATFIVDPPRTGLSKEALRGIVAVRPRRLVYVSCDVPTLARDTRGLLDAGYELATLSAMDMFPNTAHIETIAVYLLQASTNPSKSALNSPVR